MGEKKKDNIKGIRIQRMNFFMIVLSCVLYFLLLAVTLNVSSQYKDVNNSVDDLVICERDSGLLREGSAYLTEQVRLYIITADSKYMENYFHEALVSKRREQALESLGKKHSSKASYTYLVAAMDGSNELMKQEMRAMRLILEVNGGLEQAPVQVREVQLSAEEQGLSPEGMEKRARELVFGSDYQSAKVMIEENVEHSLSSIQEETHQKLIDSNQELEGSMFKQSLLLTALFIETILTFVMIICLIVKPLQIYVKCIQEEKFIKLMGSYEFKYLALTYNDIYEVNMANEKMLRYQAEHDSLTGLMNRSAFDKMKQAFHDCPNPVALLLLDVDNFKQINDGWGHDVGDRVLKEIARQLAENFRTPYCPFRIGGDEFAVIIPGITHEQEREIVDIIVDINAHLIAYSQDLSPVSLSAGVVISPQGFSDDLYKKADLALYDVKKNGRCGCRFYGENVEAPWKDK